MGWLGRGRGEASARNMGKASAGKMGSTGARNVGSTGARNMRSARTGDVGSTSARNVRNISARNVGDTSAWGLGHTSGDDVRHSSQSCRLTGGESGREWRSGAAASWNGNGSGQRLDRGEGDDDRRLGWVGSREGVGGRGLRADGGGSCDDLGNNGDGADRTLGN